MRATSSLLAMFCAWIVMPVALTEKYPVLAQTVMVEDQTTAAERLLQQCRSDLQAQQFEAALQSCQRSATTHRDIDDRAGEGRSLNNVGIAYVSLGQFQKAIEYYQKGLLLVQEAGDRDAEGIVLSRLGEVYSTLENYSLAIEAVQQAFNIAQQIGNQQLEVRASLILSNAYNSTKQFQKAIEISQQAITAAREINDRETEARSLVNLAFAYNSLNQHQQAVEYAEQALSIAREIDNYDIEARALNNLGRAYVSLKQYQQAIVSIQQALIVAREIGNPQFEASALFLLSSSYGGLEQYQQTLEYAQQALSVARETNDQEIEFGTLVIIGGVYEQLKQYTDSIEFYQQALFIARASSNQNWKGHVLYRLGKLYDEINQPQQSVEYFQQALPIYRELEQRGDELQILQSLGFSLAELNQYQQALGFLQQALEIVQSLNNSDANEAEGVLLAMQSLCYSYLGQYQSALSSAQQALSLTEVPVANGMALVSLGLVYSSLGQYQLALDYAQRSLEIGRSVGNPDLESLALFIIGYAYAGLSQSQPEADYSQRATDFLQQSLEVGRATHGRQGEVIALIGLSQVYADMEQLQLAIEYAQQGLTISREINDRLQEATSLSALSYAYEKSGQPQEAILAAQNALAFAQETGAQDTQSFSLAVIGKALAQQNQPELAIIFLKEAVRTSEEIRAELRELPRELQVAFINVKQRSDTYRKLADLLLQQDRILEAQRVLDLLKVQELEDYLRDVRGNEQTQPGIANRPPETQVQQRANAILDRAIELGKELAQLETIARDQRSPEQQTRIQQLRQQQQTITQAFLDFLGSEQVQAIIAQLRQNTDGQSLDLTNITALQDNLRNLKQDAVLLYPFVLENRLELVLVTPDAPPVRQTVSVRREDLNRAIVELRNALKDPTSDAITPAQRLYHLLIQPIESQLAAAGAKTIIYAPDGALRYIPLAALHDGKEWLAQRFRINNITAVSLTELNTVPNRTPAVFAGAFTEGSYPITVGDRQQTFAGLEFAGREVENVAALIPDTTERLNQAFNRDTVLEMNDYTIVHLATHAAFVPNSPDESFILFGDGKPVTLREIKTWGLSNVDLVVLSACETGLGDQLGDGREILGLGYQIQRTGARAALASLWQVSDGGTQILMNAFYTALEKGMTKTEALRQAQVALITGDLTAVGAPRGATIAVLSQETGLPLQVSSRLDHPYYWAPFILIGNGL